MGKADLERSLKDLEKSKLPGWISAHLKRYVESGGKEGHLWDASLGGGKGMIPTLVLTTVGRRSGEKRSMPLIYGTADGGAYVVVASKGGAPDHPGWFKNLSAEPEVELQVATEHVAARARVATGAERSEA